MKDLKPKKQKAIEKKSNNQPRSTIIFNDLISKRKKMSELHDSFDYNNLEFKYVGLTKTVSFYEYMDSKERLNKIKHNQIRFKEAKKKQENFFKKLNEVKIGRRNYEQEKVMDSYKQWILYS